MTIPIPHELALEQEPFSEQELDEVLDTGPLSPEQLAELEGHLAPELVAVHRWQIEDDQAAEWAMRMLAAIDLETSGIREQAALWVERINAWRNEATGRLHQRADFFDAQLRMYAIRVRRADPKRATISLPSGKISTRAPKEPKVEIANEEEFVKWAAETLPEEEFEQVVETVEKARILAIRKLVRVDSRNVIDNDDGHGNVEQHTEYSIVWDSTGEVVAGLSAELGAATATATPAL